MVKLKYDEATLNHDFTDLLNGGRANCLDFMLDT